jgi:hypothetical protein
VLQDRLGLEQAIGLGEEESDGVEGADEVGVDGQAAAQGGLGVVELVLLAERDAEVEGGCSSAASAWR